MVAIKDVELGTVVNIPSLGIKGATLIALAKDGGLTSFSHLLGWKGDIQNGIYGWDLQREKLWFDKITHSFQQDEWDTRYNKGYWVAATTEVEISDTAKVGSSKVKDLPLGTIVDIEYYGLLQQGTIIGKSKHGDVLIGWPKTLDHQSDIRLVNTTSGNVYLESGWEYLASKAELEKQYPKSKWVTANSKATRQYEPTKVAVSTLQYGDVIDTEYLGTIKGGTILGKQKVSGNLLIGWPAGKETVSNTVNKRSMLDTLKYHTGSGYEYLLSSEEMLSQYPNAAWITGKEYATLVKKAPYDAAKKEEEVKIFIIKDIDSLLGQLTQFRADASKRTIANAKDISQKLIKIAEKIDLLPEELASDKTVHEKMLLLTETVEKETKLLLEEMEKKAQATVLPTKDTIVKQTLSDRVEYRLNGKLHNDKDQPAVIYTNGDQFWYQHGQLHREGDQPAIIYANGYQAWYQDDQLHREGDQPAVIYTDGTKEYWFKGKPAPSKADQSKSSNPIVPKEVIVDRASLKEWREVFQNIDAVIIKRSTPPPSSLGTMLKKDATSAAYRIATTQITNGIKGALLAILTKQGSSSQHIKAFSEMMETELGTSFIACLMGIGLQYTSLVKDTRAQRLAEEFRVHGMSTAGNAAFDMLMEIVGPAIKEALSTLPKQEVRIAVPTKVEVPTLLPIEIEFNGEEEEEKQKQLEV